MTPPTGPTGSVTSVKSPSLALRSWTSSGGSEPRSPAAGISTAPGVISLRRIRTSARGSSKGCSSLAAGTKVRYQGQECFSLW